jgi:hypothetical protein
LVIGIENAYQIEWGAKRLMGHQKANGAPKGKWGLQKANGACKVKLALMTFCYWLGMQSKAGADDLLSLVGIIV